MLHHFILWIVKVLFLKYDFVVHMIYALNYFSRFFYIFFTKKVENLCWLQVTHRRVKKLIYSCSVIYENKKPLLFTFFNLWIKPLKETCLKERTFKENVFKNEIESNWGILEILLIF